MKRATVIVLGSLLVIFLGALLAVIIPFIGFGGSYNTVAADAAALYGLDFTDYKLEFKNDVINSRGEKVEGYYRASADGAETIVVKTSWSRPMVVATIFHEFAHAAQRKFNLEHEGLNLEQHAEVLSFQTMWTSKYRYNAVHMLTMHLIGKSDEYRATSQIYSIAFTK